MPNGLDKYLLLLIGTPLGKSNSLSINFRRLQPLAELSPAERSGAVAERSEAFGPSEVRRDPEPREGRQGKLGCNSTAAHQMSRLSCLGRRESVLCTDGTISCGT